MKKKKKTTTGNGWMELEKINKINTQARRGGGAKGPETGPTVTKTNMEKEEPNGMSHLLIH